MVFNILKFHNNFLFWNIVGKVCLTDGNFFLPHYPILMWTTWRRTARPKAGTPEVATRLLDTPRKQVHSLQKDRRMNNVIAISKFFCNDDRKHIHVGNIILPDFATSLTSTPIFLAIPPKVVKMTKPAIKLVTTSITAINMASLQTNTMIYLPEFNQNEMLA